MPLMANVNILKRINPRPWMRKVALGKQYKTLAAVDEGNE